MQGKVAGVWEKQVDIFSQHKFSMLRFEGGEEDGMYIHTDTHSR